MRKASKTSHNLFPTRDSSPLSHDDASLEAERRDISGDRDDERFVTIPVVIPNFEAEVSHNTVQVSVSLDSPPTYWGLLDEIMSASEGLLWSFVEGDGDEFATARREVERCIYGHVYFVWDFAPRIRFTRTHYTIPRYGTSEISCLDSEELSEHLHAAHTGRIAYILVAIELTRDKVTENGLEELEQPQRENQKWKGTDSRLPETVPKELSEERGKSTTSLKERPLAEQVSQTASSQGDAIKTGRRGPVRTGKTMHTRPYGKTKEEMTMTAYFVFLGTMLLLYSVVRWLTSLCWQIVNSVKEQGRAAI
ncbi:hypothetical protein GGR58DRAFT_423573 [Xylaria digitata]|nr:hypothetical protein GGR58DRAFT_423573 [Xylaria digitata]